MPDQHFIRVNSTSLDGAARIHHINVGDILQTATDSRNGGCIITVRNSQHAVWTNESIKEVEQLMRYAGANIHALS